MRANHGLKPSGAASGASDYEQELLHVILE
jgi:hypothetical protein